MTVLIRCSVCGKDLIQNGTTRDGRANIWQCPDIHTTDALNNNNPVHTRVYEKTKVN